MSIDTKTNLLIQKPCDLNGAFDVDHATLEQVLESIGEESALYLAECVHKRRLREFGESIKSPNQTRELLRSMLWNQDKERFVMLMLDNQHRFIDSKIVATGTIDSAMVYPRECVKEMLANGAVSAILAHNHPGGACEPSQADRRITRRLSDAFGLLDMRILDHFIVTDREFYSFAEHGIL